MCGGRAGRSKQRRVFTAMSSSIAAKTCSRAGEDMAPKKDKLNESGGFH